MKKKYLRFLPLLAFYLTIVVLFSSNAFQADEAGYVKYALRFLHGVSPSTPPPVLWWGPGYPLVLAPFALLNLPWLAAKLLNAFFLFGSVIYLYKTLGLFIDDRYATLFALIWGLYPPIVRQVHMLMTESLTFFLMCGFMYHFCKLHRKPGHIWVQIFTTAAFLGYLAMTKVLFGYVISVGLLVYLVFYLWRRSESARRTTLVFLIALSLCIPYLLFTFSRTGRIFYWSSAGGSASYWLTTSRSPQELGSWFGIQKVMTMPQLASYRDLWESTSKLPEVAADDLLKQAGLDNIRKNPKTYLVNWVANLGRLFLQYPYSYEYQKLSNLYSMLPNMFILVACVLSIYPAFLGRKAIPHEIYVLLFIFLVAAGGNSLVSALERYFRPLVPILLLWLAYISLRVLKIELRLKPEPPAQAG